MTLVLLIILGLVVLISLIAAAVYLSIAIYADAVCNSVPNPSLWSLASGIIGVVPTLIYLGIRKLCKKGSCAPAECCAKKCFCEAAGTNLTRFIVSAIAFVISLVLFILVLVFLL